MEPTLRDGDVILVNRLAYFLTKPKAGDTVAIKWEKYYIIKRIKKISHGKIFIVGDNKGDSADSRRFGWINKKEIIGKVMFKI